MTESMYGYFKAGLIHFMAYPDTIRGEGPIQETVERVAEDDYFNAIEITHIKDAHVRQSVKSILNTSGMTVAFGAQPQLMNSGYNINDVDEAGRVKAVEFLKGMLDEAYEMGAVGFGFLSGHYTQAGKEEAYRSLVKSTKELCAYAKSLGGITVAHEVFDYDIEKKSLVGPAALAKRYAQEVRAEYANFGLMVDLSHLPLIGETSEEALLPVKDYIVHAHMGNCVVKEKSLPAYGDAHPRFGFPNSENGVDELVEYLRVLIRTGYLNKAKPPILSFEVKPFGNENPEVVIASSKRALNEAWSRV
jgi:sugar phosphate isomerase/epimerase